MTRGPYTKTRKRRSDWSGLTPAQRDRQYKMRKRLHPEWFACLCGDPGVDFDYSTNSVRCARCAWCENQQWVTPADGNPINSRGGLHYRQRFTVIEPYVLHQFSQLA